MREGRKGKTEDQSWGWVVGAGERREKNIYFDQLHLPPTNKNFAEYLPIIFFPGLSGREDILSRS